MDFGLKVNRLSTQAGNYTTDLAWVHVRNTLGYNIYRSEKQSDDPADWYKINTKVIQVNYFQDRGFIAGTPTQNDRSQWFYKVIPVLQDNSEYPLSQSKTETFSKILSGIQRFVAPTIRMRTDMMLDPSRFSAAETVHFLCRKWSGHYCDCIDIRTRKVDSNCPKCFGTGFEGGFELIENIYCRIKSSPQRLQGNSGGITVQETTSGTITTYPLISDSDIIVREHNARYFLREVKARQIQGYITAQAFNLEKVQLYDMAYRIPTPPIVSNPTRQVSLMTNAL